jgi:molybdopterin-guanine dinucleotide biosynthesis protein A
MAGIAACLPQCQHDTSYIIPCDTPYLSPEWLIQLERQKTRNLAIIEHNARLQLVMLMDTSLQSSLAHTLENRQLALMQWVYSIDHDIVAVGLDPRFTNVNTQGDLTD